MARAGGSGGAVVTGDSASGPVWIVLCQGALGAEEEEILHALLRVAARAGARIHAILLGTASYRADMPHLRSSGGPTRLYVPEEEFRGRGIRRGSDESVTPVTYEQIVTWLFEAEKVIALP